MATNDKEELERRNMRALIRQAGTSIRTAELQRQLMNAQLNIDFALNLQKNIKQDFEIIMEPIQKTIKEGERTAKSDDADEDLLLNCALTLLKEGSIALTKLPPGTLRRHVVELNDFTDNVLNKIINDLTKEGIYLPKFIPINPDGMFLLAIHEARDQSDRAVGFLKGIIDTQKKKK